VRKGEVCGFILRNDLYTPLYFKMVNPTVAAAQMWEMDNSLLPELRASQNTMPWDIRNFKKVYNKSNALPQNKGIFFLVGSLDWGIGVPSRDQYIEVIYKHSA
jgi:hypothetical protein